MQLRSLGCQPCAGCSDGYRVLIMDRKNGTEKMRKFRMRTADLPEAYFDNLSANKLLAIPSKAASSFEESEAGYWNEPPLAQFLTRF